MDDPLRRFRPAPAVRLVSALRRRLRHAWRRAVHGRRRPPVEAALDWLLGLEVDGCLAEPLNPARGLPGLTAASIATVASYGCRAEAARWARWLVSIQHADGSFPSDVATTRADRQRRPSAAIRNDSPEPSAYTTALAMNALLSMAHDSPELEQPARRASAFLRAAFDDDGQVRPTPECPNIDDRWQAVASLLPALHQAARRWNDPACRRAAERGAEVLLAGGRETGRSGPGYFSPYAAVIAHQAEVLADLECLDAAAELLGRIGACQRRSGAVPVLIRRRLGEPNCPSIRSTAHAAALWYRMGRPDRAEPAVRYLERRQARDGRLPQHSGRRASARDPGDPGDPEAVRHYLDAALLRVAAAFDERWHEFPDTIDPADGRVKAVRAWAEGLAPGARVADVGCGKGRFLKHLAGWLPDAHLTGVDVSSAMLEHLPPGVEPQVGSLLRIPSCDGRFDAAFAIESLEHALVPDRALAELCRVVRPGGRVLVIDKHRARQPLSEHDPWERWFLPEELARWLARDCDQVTVEPVSHTEGRPGNTLFLAARGRRKTDL